MTSRQWQLYNLLKRIPNHWFTQEEICREIAGYKYIDDERNHCVEIGEDRIKINDDPTVDKIIVTKSHCFKIANWEEYSKERASQIKKAKNLLNQIKAKDRKYERDGQGKLFSNILTELTDNHEQYHQTFFDEVKVLVDLISKKTYIVKNSSTEIVNETTAIVTTKDGRVHTFTPIHEIINYDALNRPFYENYEKVVVE